jgi:hypothetical protein
MQKKKTSSISILPTTTDAAASQTDLVIVKL